MKPIREMEPAELGAFIQSHLRKKGITVVLSGGAVVSIYSKGLYVSKDLDLVNIYSKKIGTIREAMSEIDFNEEARYFKHPESQIIVEFPPGPLTVGEEPVKQINKMVLPTGTLEIISPTDSVKDRLAAYYHWGDRQSLAQAILVAKENVIDLEEIRRWSIAEGKLDEFNLISAELTATHDSQDEIKPNAQV